MANAGGKDAARANATDRHARSLRAKTSPTFHKTDSAFDRAHGRSGSSFFAFMCRPHGATFVVRPVEGGWQNSSYTGHTGVGLGGANRLAPVACGGPLKSASGLRIMERAPAARPGRAPRLSFDQPFFQTGENHAR